MALLYDVSMYIGYFWILLIFLVIAVIIGKKTAGWIVYGIGALIQLFALYGNSQSYSMMGSTEAMTPYWIVYIVLLIVAAILMIIRGRKQ